MAEPTFQSLRGMHDVLPPESERWRELVDRFAEQFGRSGYGYIQTPVLEELAVFARVGEGTDVVTKEMYDFEDRDGDRIALRPESTAGVARSFLQHHPLVPWKVWYSSQHFRYERPQAGRYRQHHQLGAECLGSGDPDIDVELIVGLWDFYRSLGLQRLRMELNSIGDPASRGRYQDHLRAFLADRVGDLHPTDQEKVDRHPMRVLDSKNEATRAALDGVPTLMDSMSDEAIDHFARVQAGIALAGIDVTLNPRLVRGLDYYTHTVFEIMSDAIEASQSTIGGGGRYDGLVESLGGPATPAVGFGSGIERVLLACDAEQLLPVSTFAIDTFVVSFDRDDDAARRLVLELRRGGIGADRALNQHNPRKQADRARRARARFVVRLGKDTDPPGLIEVVDQRDDEQHVFERVALVDGVRSLLARDDHPHR